MHPGKAATPTTADPAHARHTVRAGLRSLELETLTPQCAHCVVRFCVQVIILQSVAPSCLSAKHQSTHGWGAGWPAGHFSAQDVRPVCVRRAGEVQATNHRLPHRGGYCTEICKLPGTQLVMKSRAATCTPTHCSTLDT